MIENCRTFLTSLIQAAGIKTVLTKAEDEAKHKSTPYASVTFGQDVLGFDGSLVARSDGPGAKERTFRRRLYARNVPAKIKIVHRTPALAEQARSSILESIPRRIDDGLGNAVLLTLKTGEPEADGSVLRNQETVYIDLVCEGGIYKDSTVKVFDMETDLQITGEKED